MTCDEAKEGLSALLDGALPAAEKPAVEAHAATCAACHSYRDEIGGIRALLRSVDDADEPPVRATLGRDVVAAIAPKPRVKTWAVLVAAAVAAVMVGAVIRDVIVIRARREPAPAPGPAPKPRLQPPTPEALPVQLEGHLVAEAADAATRDALRELFRSWPGTFAAKNVGDFGLDVTFKGPAGEAARAFAKTLNGFQASHDFSSWNYSESRR